MDKQQARGLGALIAGLGLIGLGALFLLGQIFRIDFWRILWPFFIIVPGLLFFVGMVSMGKKGAPLAVPGSIVTMIGLLLLFQTVTNLWATWAYAWALIFPVSVGIGIAIAGLWSDDAKTTRAGTGMAAVGLVLFLVFGAFFELVLNVSGWRTGPFGRILFPVLLIGAGIAVVLWVLIPRRKTGAGDAPAEL